MNHKIKVFVLICAIILVSGCTDTNSNNSSISHTNNTSSLAPTNLNSMNASNTIPVSMKPGAKYNVSVTMKNTGMLSWSSSNITLCLADDINNEAALFSINNTTQYFMKSKSVIKSGTNYTWNFTIVAPTYPNNYTLMYQLLYDNATWFGDKLVVTVTDGQYTGPVIFKSNTISKSMAGGNTYKVNIKVNNTGKTTWYQSDKVALAAIDYEKNDAQWFGCNQRFYLNPGSYIKPGGQGSWNFTMTAPSEGGNFQVKFQMVKGEDNEWFGSVLNVSINVAPKK